MSHSDRRRRPARVSYLEAIVTRAVDADVIVGASIAEVNAARASPPNFACLDVDVPDGTTYDFAANLSARRRSIRLRVGIG